MFIEPKRPRVIYECSEFRIVVRMTHGSRDTDRIFDIEVPFKDSLEATNWRSVCCISTHRGSNEFGSNDRQWKEEDFFQRILALVSTDAVRVVRGTLVSQYAKEALDV